jgi:hypothetical protein
MTFRRPNDFIHDLHDNFFGPKDMVAYLVSRSCVLAQKVAVDQKPFVPLQAQSKVEKRFTLEK